MSFYSAILSQKSQFIFIFVLYISVCVLPKDILSSLALLSLPSFFSFFTLKKFFFYRMSEF